MNDSFDRVLQSCPVLDLVGPLTLEQFFRHAAQNLAGLIGIAEQVLRDLLLEREAQSPTVLSPLVAIPHVLLDGQGQFHGLVARCREGINFYPGAPQVRCAFVLAGTADQRALHLTALAAIARVTRQEDFGERWLAAGDTQALRRVVLEGYRRSLESQSASGPPA